MSTVKDVLISECPKQMMFHMDKSEDAPRLGIQSYPVRKDVAGGKKKKESLPPNILTTSQRLLLTRAQYFKSSRCPPSTFATTSSVS